MTTIDHSTSSRGAGFFCNFWVRLCVSFRWVMRGPQTHGFWLLIVFWMILGYHHVKRPTYVWSGIKPGGGYRVVLDLFGPCPHGWVFLFVLKISKWRWINTTCLLWTCLNYWVAVIHSHFVSWGPENVYWNRRSSISQWFQCPRSHFNHQSIGWSYGGVLLPCATCLGWFWTHRTGIP